MKVLVVAIFIIVTFLVLFHSPGAPSNSSTRAKAKASKKLEPCADCSIKELNMDDADVGQKNIFFVETDDSLRFFRSRHLCAFEAAAAHNPDSVVHVVIGAGSNITAYPAYLKKLHNNLRFVRADFDRLMEGTPVVDLWQSKVVAQSWCYTRHASHIIRLVLLHKFGGTYLDTDVVVLAKLPEGDNFVVPYERNSINGAVIRFQKEQIFTLDSLKYLVSS
jgi:hypothetical protein